MSNTDTSMKMNDLGLTDKNAGCACCSPADESTVATSQVIEAPFSTTLSVTGLTCNHCVSSVTEEISAIEGVDRVAIDLVVGGTSTVTVDSSAPLDDGAIRAAIDEAGYTLVGSAS
jgi:copper chaperone CopZ